MAMTRHIINLVVLSWITAVWLYRTEIVYESRLVTTVTSALNSHCYQSGDNFVVEQFYKLSDKSTAVYVCRYTDSCSYECSAPVYSGMTVYIDGTTGGYSNIVSMFWYYEMRLVAYFILMSWTIVLHVTIEEATK